MISKTNNRSFPASPACFFLIAAGGISSLSNCHAFTLNGARGTQRASLINTRARATSDLFAKNDSWDMDYEPMMEAAKKGAFVFLASMGAAAQIASATVDSSVVSSNVVMSGSFETLDFSLPSYNEGVGGGSSTGSDKTPPSFANPFADLKLPEPNVPQGSTTSAAKDEDAANKKAAEEKSAADAKADKKAEAKAKAEAEAKADAEAKAKAEAKAEAKAKRLADEKVKQEEAAKRAREVEETRAKEVEAAKAEVKAVEKAPKAEVKVVEKAPAPEVPAFSVPDLPKVSIPSFSAPKFDMPKMDAPTPKIDAPKFEAPKFDAPKFEAPKIPKFDAPASPYTALPDKFAIPAAGVTAGSASSQEDEFLEPQEVRDEKARNAKIEYKRLDLEAKAIENQARKARTLANNQKKEAAIAKGEACKTRLGGKILCVRGFGVGY